MARSRALFPKIDIDEIVDKIYEKFADRTTKDAFAGVAMALLLMSSEGTADEIADEAYLLAEAMMKRRESDTP